MNRIEITQDNFDSEVRGSVGLMLVMFMADWCPACRTSLPVFDSVFQEHINGDVKFGIANVDESPQLVATNELMVVPMFILFKDGREVERKDGRRMKGELSDMIARHA